VGRKRRLGGVLEVGRKRRFGVHGSPTLLFLPTS
jgi:hypothetical protein